MMLFSFAMFVVMFILLLIIMSADMNGTAKITAVILAALMYIFMYMNTSYLFEVEKGKEIALNSISTPYTKTELYNMSDAEKDLLLKTYSGATVKYWKIDDNKENK